MKPLGCLPAGIAAAVLTVVLTGCASEWSKDAPREKVDETSAARVIQMPDGFSNVATKCVDGIRFSTIFHYNSDGNGGNGAYGAVSTVVDPRCK